MTRQLTSHFFALYLPSCYRTSRKWAVGDVTFGVRKGECFGLLGVNGAGALQPCQACLTCNSVERSPTMQPPFEFPGKSTTFGCLTGSVRPSGGDAWVAGHHILQDQAGVHQNMGYCPQRDALLPLLTPVEHLRLFAGLQGMSTHDAEAATEQLLLFLDLSHFRTTRAGYLSGGNRRKLSLALALLGDKSVIFLDEPSAGLSTC